MSVTIVPAPVRRSVQVKAAPAKALERFAAGMGRWWLKTPYQHPRRGATSCWSDRA